MLTAAQYERLRQILVQYTYPKDQFGFVTEDTVIREIAKVFNQ